VSEWESASGSMWAVAWVSALVWGLVGVSALMREKAWASAPPPRSPRLFLLVLAWG